MECKCGKELEKILDTSYVVQHYNQAVDVFYCYTCGRVAIDKWIECDSDIDPFEWYEHKGLK